MKEQDLTKTPIFCEPPIWAETNSYYAWEEGVYDNFKESNDYLYEPVDDSPSYLYNKSSGQWEQYEDTDKKEEIIEIEPYDFYPIPKTIHPEDMDEQLEDYYDLNHLVLCPNCESFKNPNNLTWHELSSDKFGNDLLTFTCSTCFEIVTSIMYPEPVNPELYE